jgi:hypothetical protein
VAKLSQDSCPARKAGVKREGQLVQGPSSEAFPRCPPRPTVILPGGAGGGSGGRGRFKNFYRR